MLQCIQVGSFDGCDDANESCVALCDYLFHRTEQLLQLLPALQQNVHLTGQPCQLLLLEPPLFLQSDAKVPLAMTQVLSGL